MKWLRACTSGLTTLQNALVGAVSSVFSQCESSKSESDEDFEQIKENNCKKVIVTRIIIIGS